MIATSNDTIKGAASPLLPLLVVVLSLAAGPVAECFVVKEQPPMPFKWPFVGTLPDFVARGGADKLRDIYEDMYAEYGAVFGMSIMGDDELIVSDPRIFDAVVRKEGKYPVSAGEAATTLVDYYRETNNTMMIKSSSRGVEWKEWRTPLERDLYAEWRAYVPAIAETANRISKVAGYEVTEAKNIAFVDFISRSAFDMFTTVMFGESPQTTDSRAADPHDVEFVQSSQTAFDLTGKLMLSPLEKTFGGDTYKHFKVNMDRTIDFAYKKTEEFVSQVKQRQEAAPEGESGDVSAGGKCPVTAIKENMPFLERLVHRGQLPEDEIVSTSGPLLMAGVDTTAYVMSWLYLNLASNPDVQAKLADELRTVLNGADVTSAEQLDSLPYLKACVRESHRLSPAVPSIPKMLKEDMDVVVDEESGTAYRVPAGHRISLNLRAFPMDPRYVEDPAAYRPERFLPDAIEARRGTVSEIVDHPSFADPFGRGKRRCLGSNVAAAEIEILTARLVQDWEISLADPNDAGKWTAKPKLMLKADPYPAMKLIPRK